MRTAYRTTNVLIGNKQTWHFGPQMNFNERHGKTSPNAKRIVFCHPQHNRSSVEFHVCLSVIDAIEQQRILIVAVNVDDAAYTHRGVYRQI